MNISYIVATALESVPNTVPGIDLTLELGDDDPCKGVGVEDAELVVEIENEERLAAAITSLENISAYIETNDLDENSGAMFGVAVESVATLTYGMEDDNAVLHFPQPDAYEGATKDSAISYSRESVKVWIADFWKRIVKIWDKIRIRIMKWTDANVSAVGRMVKSANKMADKAKNLSGSFKEKDVVVANAEWLAEDKTGKRLTPVGRRNKDLIKGANEFFKAYQNKSIAGDVIDVASKSITSGNIDPSKLSVEVVKYTNTMIVMLANVYGASELNAGRFGSWMSRMTDWGIKKSVDSTSANQSTSFEAKGMVLPGIIRGTMLGVDPVVFNIFPPSSFKDSAGKKNLEVKVQALTPGEIEETFKFAAELGQIVVDNKTAIREADVTLTESTKAVKELAAKVSDDTSKEHAKVIASILRACSKNSTNVAFQVIKSYSTAARAVYGYAQASYSNIQS